jgi:hypothetical protein
LVLAHLSQKGGKATAPYIQVRVAGSSRSQLNPADVVSAITGAQDVVDGARTASGGAVTQAMQS